MPVRVVVPLVVAGLAVLAAGGWMWTHRDEPRPAAFAAEPTTAMYEVIDSRQADPRPLRLDEVFTPAGRTLGGLRRGTAEELSDCDDALWGVSATGCTQALRATYSGGGATGQFVIFNLQDGHAADALVAALGKDGFVRQAVSFDAARSRAEARALGHYVTVSWVTAADPVPALIAVDGLGRAVQARVVAAS